MRARGKTRNSTRWVDLDPQTVQILAGWRERLETELGRPLDEDDYVFCRPSGAPTHPDRFSQIFNKPGGTAIGVSSPARCNPARRPESRSSVLTRSPRPLVVRDGATTSQRTPIEVEQAVQVVSRSARPRNTPISPTGGRCA